jgi:aryl-phospho-beta-D-glucosidase BglC (GH1 family)
LGADVLVFLVCAVDVFVFFSYWYIVRLLGWTRKYGLRVNLGLHTAPGSQKGEWFSWMLIHYPN